MKKRQCKRNIFSWIMSIFLVFSSIGIYSNDSIFTDGTQIVLAASNQTQSGWKKDSNGWWYQNADGTYPKSSWKKISGSWYYFNTSGYMVTGWNKIGNSWYYMHESGKMASNEWIGNYYVNSNGVLTKTVKEGWKKDSNGWWYQNADGTYPKSSWKKISGSWYYFNTSGYMVTGWYKIGASWYYMHESGKMASNEWIGKYYVNSSGVLTKTRTAGWKQDNNGWWYQNADGTYPKSSWKQISGSWYYFDDLGYMVTGWYKIGTNWYYMHENGKMASNEWIGNKYVNDDGILVDNVSGISLNKSSVTLSKGSTETLISTITPSTATNKNVKWSSSNTNVATVSSTGVITAIGIGTAVITVTTEDGNKTSSATVYVYEPNYRILGGGNWWLKISPLNNSELAMTNSDNKVTLSSYTKTNNQLWQFGDYKEEYGGLTLSPKSKNGVSVLKALRISSKIQSDCSMILYGLGEDYQAGAWEIIKLWDNSYVLKLVGHNLSVGTTSVNEGTQLTLKEYDLFDEKQRWNIEGIKLIPATGVSLDKTSVTINKGASTTLTATVLPSDASDKSVTWSSSNTAVATVSGGKVTGVGGGTATITVRTADGGHTASCTVTVNVPPTGVGLNTNAVTINKGASTTLTATVYPGDASNKSITWSSSNTSVVTVNGGKVTGVGNGTATITVKTAEGGYTATCNVTVNVAPTGVSITNKKTLALDCNSLSNHTYQCSASVAPSDASNKNVTWSSSNTGVATVDSTGKITGVGRGTATITVKAVASGHADSFTVHVYKSNYEPPAGGNIYYKVSIASTTNRVMDVYDCNTYDGAKVQLWSLNTSDAQLWQFHDYRASNGGIAIVPKCNSGAYILDVNRGGNNYSDAFKENNLIDLWTLGQDNAASMWELIRTWEGCYVFRLVGTNWVAGVTSTAEGAQLMLRKFDPFDNNQKWCLEAVDKSNSGGMTRTQAVNWATSRIGQSIDVDGFYGAQCKDFVNAFTQENFGVTFAGNANVLITCALPAGWTRIKNTPDFIPQPGDIAIWDYSSYGHTGIIISANINTFVSIDQNWYNANGTTGSPAARVEHNYTSYNFWGVLRPPYSS
ncbi:MAG: Ig-like domain-containing protein [Lachnospiraceae bacterium]|nr:Ig-like domain-containing protein [Lachnospiraceae bacterium]